MTSILKIAHFLFLSWVAIGFSSPPVVCAEAKRPNFLVILCDDLGWGDLGCYGHPFIKTENLDRLAANGLRFTSCYSPAPVCSPSRVGLMTGRNPNRAGIYDWIPEASSKAASSKKNQDADRSRRLVHMRRDEVTLPKLLKQVGYRTCLSGKWHCNSMFNSPDQPQPNDAGFDHWFATQNNAGPSHENPVNFVRNGKPVGKLEGFSCRLVAQEAIQWLSSTSKEESEKPFFLYVAFHEPHEPIESPKDLVAQYRSVARNEDEAQHFANIHNMDAAVGDLMSAIDRLNLTEDTMIYFSSDNGPETLNRYPTANRSYGSPGPLRGMKLWTNEAGMRVAGIVKPPGPIQSGKVIDTPISSLDLLPTCCSMAGASLPKIEFDGMNIAPIFRGEKTERTKPLFWFYYNAINEQRAAMLDGKWKLLARLNGGSLPNTSNVSEANFQSIRSAELTDFSLYDLEADIGEANDLSAKEPDKLRELTAKMVGLYREVTTTMHVWPKN